ncbi:MAG: BatD family protein [Methylomonas sp.]
MRQRLVLRGLLFAALLFSMVLAQAAEIDVSVDRNPVNLNDSFQLMFSADDDPDGKPDFSVLQPQFEILNQQRSSSSSWVNGKSQHNQQWTLTVMAKHSGELLIPPVAFGANVSKPLKLTVTDKPSNLTNNEDLFLEVQATPDKPFVQSQVIYSLRLYRRVQIAQASLSEPELKEAVIEKLGEDSNYTTQIKGVDYWVTERKYAIFPQQSGVLTIPALTLNAEVVSAQAGRSSFFGQAITQNKRVSSKPITLNVQAVPAALKQVAWLSAESLQLSDQWSDSQLQVKVGEPLTRTVTLVAKGSTVGQLPELSTQIAVDGIKTYPDQPQLQEAKNSDGLTAMRQEKIAFIANQAGDYQLPEINVAWFNTKSQQLETAHLPAVTIKALPVAEPMETQVTPMAVKPQITSVENQDQVHLWQTISGLLALGWLINGVWWFKRSPKSQAVIVPPKTLVNAAEANLKQACQNNNPQAAKQALLAYFAVDSLAAIVTAGRFADEISGLNRYLYSGQSSEWRGDGLWQAFKQRPVSSQQAQAIDVSLEPLFKL